MKKAMILLTMFLLSVSLWSDNRTANLDLYLVLDKSLSMEEEIEEVIEYVNGFLLKELLIPGDRLFLIPFYGEAPILYQGKILQEEDFSSVMTEISQLRADGAYTDIGNALDMLNNIRQPESPNRKYFLLLTDGKQEAPPESPYYSPDGSYNHRFLENTRIIRDQGWKIIVLGIGNDFDAQELARELSAGYAPLEEAAENDVEELVGLYQLKESPQIHVGNQTAKLRLVVQGEGIDNRKDVHIDQAVLAWSDEKVLLLEDYPVTGLEPQGVQEIIIDFPAEILAPYKDREESSVLQLSFKGQQQIVPSVYQTDIFWGAVEEGEEEEEGENEGGQGRRRWIIAIILLAVLVIFLLYAFANRRPKDEDKNKRNQRIDEE